MSDKDENNMSHSIFREYDIRGIYGETLKDQDAYNIGKAFAQLLPDNNKLVTILRDGRISSKPLTENLIAGLKDCGANIIDFSVGPTPLLYFSNYYVKEAIAGIMITGSHNPPSHNGFKFMYDKKPFYGADIQKLKNIILNKDYIYSKGNIINYENVEIKNEYVKKLLGSYQGNRKLKIAWDPGNGASCHILNDLCYILDGEHTIINGEIDGNFPNHHPDPTIFENLKQLIDIVKIKKCDLGIAFDGDGDRIVVVDNKGRMILGDQLLAIYSINLLKKNNKITIISDVKASNNLFKLITEMGGKAIMWKTGHSLIKAKMKETSAVLAGEMSGHIFFADQYYGYDDGIYAAIRLLDILSNSDSELSDLVDMLPKSFNTPEIKIECDDEYKFKAIDKIKEILLESNIEFIDIDGIRVHQDNSWWLIRASNTQGALIARCEADNMENLILMKNIIKSYLHQVNIIVDLN